MDLNTTAVQEFDEEFGSYVQVVHKAVYDNQNRTLRKQVGKKYQTKARE